MKNNLDKQYLEIAKEILSEGNVKGTRNSVTTSLFGKTIRHKMFEGFPIYTSKKMSLKTVFTELQWFLLGRTDLRWLVERKCYIWVGDAYKRYKTKIKEEFPWIEEDNDDSKVIRLDDYTRRILKDLNAGKSFIVSEDLFIELIKTDDLFSDIWGCLGDIYGKQWRDFYSDGVSVDQIKTVLNTLKQDPNSRRIILSAWNPPELQSMVLPPCHMMFQCYTFPMTDVQKQEVARSKGVPVSEVKDMGLSLMFFCRSQDYFLGTPYNTVSYGMLLTIFATILGYEPYELIHQMGDTHIYDLHKEPIKEQLRNETFPLPKLELKGLLSGEAHQEYWYDNQFDIDGFMTKMEFKDSFTLSGYQHGGEIKAPLIN